MARPRELVNHRDREAGRYRERLERGLCGRCGNHPVVVDRKSCIKCLTESTSRIEKRKAEKKLAADRLGVIRELVDACENALHVLTPTTPRMDGLDRTRMYIREAIRKARPLLQDEVKP